MGKHFTIENIKNQFQFLKEYKISRAAWMVHPGYTSDHPNFFDPYNKQRENELRVLTRLSDFIFLNAEIVPLNKIYAN